MECAVHALYVLASFPGRFVGGGSGRGRFPPPTNRPGNEAMYVYDLSMLTQALPTLLLLNCITLQYPHTVHMHVQHLAVHIICAYM